MAEASEIARRAQRRVGQTLGKYRILGVLGTGGMASVYQAAHRNGHKVALKVLSLELASDDDIRARFVREGYAANAIDHPGVVRVIDDDLAEDGAPFLVMELLDGETLQARMLRSGGKLGAREVLALAHQLLDVVATAHTKGVLHRDLKPDNLFLTREGILKVLDFGVARMAAPESGSDPTRTGRTMGTPAFMAPEQAFGKTREIDARSDLWAVGATMFTLLSGRHVHDAENAAQLLVLAATISARSLADVEPDTPRSVVAIVDRACAFERDHRYPDARAMQRAVAEAYQTLFGADVSSAIVSGTFARTVLESAPTMDVSAPSLPNTETPRPESTKGAKRGSRGIGRRAALGIAVAVAVGLGGTALGVGALSRTASPRAPPRSAPTATSAAAACTSSARCGGQSVCRAGACVALASDDCTVVARPEDVADDRTVWVGAMFAKDGPMAHDFDGAMRDIDLGRRDFVEVTSGLPGPRPGEPPRPIGLVECNDATDPARAARHLVLDLRLPAVIGFSRSKEVADLAAMLFNPQRVVALASNTAAMLSAIPAPPGEPRMVWRTTLSSSMRIHVLTALVRDVLEPELRARKEVGRDEPIRVAFLNVDNTTGVSNTDAVVTSLRFNGKSVADNGEDFVQLLVSDGKDRHAEAERILPALARFAPHVVLDGGTGAAIIPLLETALAGKVRPRYALGSVNVDPITGARNPLLARRVFDVDTTSSTTASAKFDLRYAAVFDPTTSPTQVVTGGPYDAFYALAYALVALGDAPVTGPAIARALARLSGPGPSIDVGPGGIYAATAALQRGGAIDLEGTTTFLDFDETTGDPTVDFAIYCVKPGRDGVLRPDSGLAWDRKLRKVTGSAHCL